MKKVLSLILALVLMLSTFTTMASAMNIVIGKSGDVNFDQKIDIVDVALVRAHIVGELTLLGDSVLLADINLDGNIDIVDVAIIRKAIVDSIDLGDYTLDIEWTFEDELPNNPYIMLMINKSEKAAIVMTANMPDNVYALAYSFTFDNAVVDSYLAGDLPQGWEQMYPKNIENNIHVTCDCDFTEPLGNRIISYISFKEIGDIKISWEHMFTVWNDENYNTTELSTVVVIINEDGSVGVDVAEPDDTDTDTDTDPATDTDLDVKDMYLQATIDMDSKTATISTVNCPQGVYGIEYNAAYTGANADSITKSLLPSGWAETFPSSISSGYRTVCDCDLKNYLDNRDIHIIHFNNMNGIDFSLTDAAVRDKNGKEYKIPTKVQTVNRNCQTIIKGIVNENDTGYMGFDIDLLKLCPELSDPESWKQGVEIDFAYEIEGLVEVVENYGLGCGANAELFVKYGEDNKFNEKTVWSQDENWVKYRTPDYNTAKLTADTEGNTIKEAKLRLYNFQQDTDYDLDMYILGKAIAAKILELRVAGNSKTVEAYSDTDSQTDTESDSDTDNDS